MKLERNYAAFFSTGGDFLNGFDELDILNIVCMCTSPLILDFLQNFLPIVLV